VEKGTITVIPSSKRATRDLGWLQTTWLFSFDDYYDPDNLEFGVLRVFNDDVIAPGKGFPAHRHSEMEIVTCVLEGRLSHRDSAGNQGFLGPGEVQRMTAGTGVLHSEMNEGRTPVHLYQIWFLPSRGGMKPSYQQGKFPIRERPNALVPLVSDKAMEGALTLNAPATLYGCLLEKGRELSVGGPGRRLYMYVTSGQVGVDGTVLERGDQLRYTASQAVRLEAQEDADLVLIDMSGDG
jgi:redox-sensitive bicupin YhaK (pirin superfamily)